MPIRITVNGKPPGQDRLLASAAGRRFPALVCIANTGDTAVNVELRVSGGQALLECDRWSLAPGASVETKLHAEAASQAEGDILLEALVDGVAAGTFRFTAVSLLRESVFHNFLSGRRG